MKPAISNIQFVFDVESNGLHGEAFAVAYVVYKDGTLVAENSFSCPPSYAAGLRDDITWVSKNVPELPQTHTSVGGVLDAFWDAWIAWKDQGAQMFAECAWPVEARFLIECIKRQGAESNWNGPYPLHEIASFMAAAGMDPMASYPYEEGETKHDPLSDARQSARLLRMALEKLTPAQPTPPGWAKI